MLTTEQQNNLAQSFGFAIKDDEFPKVNLFFLFHELFSSSDFDMRDLFDFVRENFDQSLAIIGALEEKEHQFYRKDHPIIDVNTQVYQIIAFLIGTTNGDINLQTIKNHRGERVRTKPAPHFKPPENLEFLAVISKYLDSEEERNEIMPELLSETVDIIYNLLKLALYDHRKKDDIRKLIEQFCQILGMNYEEIFCIMLSKYQIRYYRNDGKNYHPQEKGAISQLISQDGSSQPALISHQITADRITLLAIWFTKCLSPILRAYSRKIESNYYFDSIILAALKALEDGSKEKYLSIITGGDPVAEGKIKSMDSVLSKINLKKKKQIKFAKKIVKTFLAELQQSTQMNLDLLKILYKDFFERWGDLIY